MTTVFFRGWLVLLSTAVLTSAAAKPEAATRGEFLLGRWLEDAKS